MLARTLRVRECAWAEKGWQGASATPFGPLNHSNLNGQGGQNPGGGASRACGRDALNRPRGARPGTAREGVGIGAQGGMAPILGLGGPQSGVPLAWAYAWAWPAWTARA